MSHLSDGKRWYYGIVRDKDELQDLESVLEGVEWKQENYRDIREDGV